MLHSFTSQDPDRLEILITDQDRETPEGMVKYPGLAHVPVLKQFTDNKMPSAHLMIDLETVGRPSKGRDGVQILTIGIATMGVLKGLIPDGYIKIRPALDSRFTHDEDTLNWWRSQNPEVRNEALSGTMSHEDAALVFLEYFRKCKEALRRLIAEKAAAGEPNVISEDIGVWGNGSGYDISIISAWLEILGHEVPWEYYHVFDMRTATLLFPKIARVRPPAETAHNALTDAQFQALSVHRILTGE